MTSHAERVAAAVRSELARQRIPQATIAARLGISQAAVSRRLSGVVPFDVSELAEVADVLGADVGVLARGAA